MALAERLNSRLEKTHDSVDLDNLFEFLTEVQTDQNHIISDIDQNIKEFDSEVSHLFSHQNTYIPHNILTNFFSIVGERNTTRARKYNCSTRHRPSITTE